MAPSRLSGCAWVLCASQLTCGFARAQPAPEELQLSHQIASLDAQVFDAYNRCDLKTFSRFFDPAVEFYHDQGGATFDRKTLVENTRKYICNKVRRELLQDTFKVYPIKDYGAIEEGEHRFCQVDTGQCEGIARFVMVWHKRGDSWQLTRILSFGHRALAAGE